MTWSVILILFSILQNRFYKFKTKNFVDLAVPFWAFIYLELWISELIRRVFSYIDLEWWIGVAGVFTGFLIGELGNILFEREGKFVMRKWQSLPSFFSFCAIYVMLAWIYESNSALSFQAVQLHILIISISSVFLTIILTAISDRLLLSDVPKIWQGLPILLVTAIIFLTLLLGIVKNFLP